MGKIGYQDVWLAGSRFRFKRDAINSVEQPWIDFGSIDPANVNFETESIEIEDTTCGRKTTLDQAITKTTETVDITGRNFSIHNLSVAFIGSQPVELTQAAAQKRVTHKMFPGYLTKVHDSDTAKTSIHRLSAIAGLLSAAPGAGVLSIDAFTAIVSATKTITTAGDLTSHLSPGDSIVIEGTGLANILNAGTYTVASTTATTVVVNEAFAADESAITGSLIYKATGDSGTVYDKGVDWEPESLDMGYLRTIKGGAISTTQDAVVVFSTAAITGIRQFDPQAGGEIKGQFELYWNRAGCEEINVREGRCQLAPAGTQVSVEQASTFTLTLTVLTDNTATKPSGTMKYIKGPETDLS